MYISWHALAAVNFGYPLWHEVLNIEETIQTHGPKNTKRPLFHHTDKSEHERLFAFIVDAIHDSGRNLEQLSYYDTTGRRLGLLLTPPEIIHLHDVANLINAFRIVGLLSIGALLFLCGTVIVKGQRLPSGSRLALGGGVLMGIVTVIVLVLDPVQAFYGLHVLIFPPEHEWFFYYSDSLMSMMMQAPNLFGPIAVLWFIVAALLAMFSWIGFGRILQKRRVQGC